MSNLLRRQILGSQELGQTIQIIARTSQRATSTIVRQAYALRAEVMLYDHISVITKANVK